VTAEEDEPETSQAMGQEFDVFISYSSADETWVRNLRNSLVAQGVRVWSDRDQIRPGDRFIDALETGLASSKCVAVVVSPNSVRSGWVKEEYHRALSLQSQVRLIPLLLADAELPGFLGSRKWVDFRDPSQFDRSIEELHWGITGVRVEGDRLGYNSKPIPQPPPAIPIHFRFAFVLAICLTLVTGLVFGLWHQKAQLHSVEYLIVLAAWSLVTFTIDWGWQFLRSRKRKTTPRSARENNRC
jgi:hypothetical protein